MNYSVFTALFPLKLRVSIRLSTNFMTLIPSMTFTDYEWFPWSICNGCGMPEGHAYPSGQLVPSPIVGLACASIVETRFLELAMSLLDFSPRIPLGTFSILLYSRKAYLQHQYKKMLGHPYSYRITIDDNRIPLHHICVSSYLC